MRRCARLTSRRNPILDRQPADSYIAREAADPARSRARYERRVPRRDCNQCRVARDSRRPRWRSGGPAVGDERVLADARVAVVDRRLAWRCIRSEARVLGWRCRVRPHFGSLRGRVVDPRAMRVSFDAGGVRGAGDAYRIGGDRPRVSRRRAGQGDWDMDRAQLDRRGYRAVHRGSVDRRRLVAPDLSAQCAARTRDRDADCSWRACGRERWHRRASGLPWGPLGGGRALGFGVRCDRGAGARMEHPGGRLARGRDSGSHRVYCARGASPGADAPTEPVSRAQLHDRKPGDIDQPTLG